jgi:hypothetical protein
MQRNARNAFTALEKLGAPIYDRAEYGAHFILGGELRTNDDHYFADYWQEEIKEHVNEAGQIVNAFGIRQDVIDILNANDLYAEWINGGMVGIYDI